jgi:DNA-directed RNA polymerase specialized sigma24 family protein
VETPSTIEDDLEQVLREGEHGFFMRVLIEQLGPRMQAQILRHSRGFLQQADLDDIYSKSLVEIYKAISKPGFDSTRPLRLVNTIIECRTIDACRKRTRQKFNTNSDEFLGLLAERQSQKGVISAWFALSQNEQFRLMMVGNLSSNPFSKQLANDIRYHRTYESEPIARCDHSRCRSGTFQSTCAC